jgi:hypothetical protein
MNKDTDDIFETSSCSGSHQNVVPEEDNAQEDKEMKDRIIKKEEKAVRNSRWLAITAIIACAVAVSTAIYFFAKKNDHDTFELEVRNNRHIHCCNIVIATDDVLTQTLTPHLMTRPSV